MAECGEHLCFIFLILFLHFGSMVSLLRMIMAWRAGLKRESDILWSSCDDICLDRSPILIHFTCDGIIFSCCFWMIAVLIYRSLISRIHLDLIFGGEVSGVF